MKWNHKLLIAILCTSLINCYYIVQYYSIAVESSVGLPIANLSILSYTRFNVPTDLPKCQQPHLIGPLAVSTAAVSLDEVEKKWSPVSTSVSHNAADQEMHVWRPATCESKIKADISMTVAIILPYRNREANLSIFLNHIHPFLRHQHINYAIYVIEQNEPHQFNRAALFNVGYREAMKRVKFDCFIFHDVDLLPEDDRNIYTCSRNPLHLSVAIDKFGYRLLYSTLFGGAVALRPAHFERVKGFANIYYGWGAEDDDMSLRLRKSRLFIDRYPTNIARYIMMKHSVEDGNQPNPKRHNVLAGAAQNQKIDTFNTLRYRVISQGVKSNGIFFHVKVDLLYPLPEKHV